MFSDSYGNNDSPCQSRGCWLWLQEAERGGVCKSPGEHGQNSSKRTVPKKHCPVIPWPEHARLVAGKVGRCDFWNLARLQIKIGEATSPDLLPPHCPEKDPSQVSPCVNLSRLISMIFIKSVLCSPINI